MLMDHRVNNALFDRFRCRRHRRWSKRPGNGSAITVPRHALRVWRMAHIMLFVRKWSGCNAGYTGTRTRLLGYTGGGIAMQVADRTSGRDNTRRIMSGFRENNDAIEMKTRTTTIVVRLTRQSLHQRAVSQRSRDFVLAIHSFRPTRPQRLLHRRRIEGKRP